MTTVLDTPTEHPSAADYQLRAEEEKAAKAQAKADAKAERDRVAAEKKAATEQRKAERAAATAAKKAERDAARANKVAGPRIIKAGGAKGQAIIEALTEDATLTRAELAARVGATTGRVGEVIRYLAAYGAAEEQALIARHRAAQPSSTNPAPDVDKPKRSRTKKSTNAVAELLP
jgi:hypothetical protein